MNDIDLTMNGGGCDAWIANVILTKLLRLIEGTRAFSQILSRSPFSDNDECGESVGFNFILNVKLTSSDLHLSYPNTS
jgi:hypothetical protein